MRIVQMIHSLFLGDAVGNDALALHSLLISMGFETAIYTEHVDHRVKSENIGLPAYPLPQLSKEDVLIYHLSTGSRINDKLHTLKCHKIAIYHNVTPSRFFLDYDTAIYNSCEEGVKQVKRLTNVFDYCFAASTYNREDLLRYGYECPVDVLPILIPFEDYDKEPNKYIVNKYGDGRTNILFVGRVVPNKKWEDVIAAFSCYKKTYDSSARLFLVGNSEGFESYKNRLDEYVRQLKIKDVYFSGKVPFDEILAYYQIADIFLCMSEHEGFCVPLVEAMYFDVPIIAYASCAIPDTLGGSGVLLPKKDSLITAGIINKVINDNDLKEKIIKSQRERLLDFSYDNVSNRFKRLISNFIKENK